MARVCRESVGSVRWKMAWVSRELVSGKSFKLMYKPRPVRAFRFLLVYYIYYTT